MSFKEKFHSRLTENFDSDIFERLSMNNHYLEVLFFEYIDNITFTDSNLSDVTFDSIR